MNTMLENAAARLWSNGWALSADDEESRARLLFEDQVRRTKIETGLVDFEAIDAWFCEVAEGPVPLSDPRSDCHVTILCAKLPDRIARKVTTRAAVYLMQVRRVRSNRPWSVEWVIPIDRFGPTGVWVCDTDIADFELMQVQ